MSALTKILIVLSTVFSIVLSVIMVLMVSKQENYKSQVDAANSGRLAAVAALVKAQDDLNIANGTSTTNSEAASSAATKLQAEQTSHAADNAKAESERLALQSQLSQAQNQLAMANASVQTLADSNKEKDKRLDELTPRVQKLTAENSDLNKMTQEQSNQLRAAEQAMRKLQEQTASSGTTTGSLPGGNDSQVQVLSSANQTHAAVNAKISNIAQSAGRTLLDLPLGTRDGVQVNTKLMIYRSSGYVGEAVVQRATADESVAVVTTTKPGETVRNDDMVSTDK